MRFLSELAPGVKFRLAQGNSLLLKSSMALMRRDIIRPKMRRLFIIASTMAFDVLSRLLTTQRDEKMAFFLHHGPDCEGEVRYQRGGEESDGKAAPDGLFAIKTNSRGSLMRFSLCDKGLSGKWSMRRKG